MGMSESIDTPNPFRRPKLVAGSVLVAGLLASIAGNVQSILLEAGSPGIGSMISALWWPAILFGMIELAIHTPWGKTPLWLTVQWSGSGIIGAVAFYISYFHLAHVLSSFGYDTVSRYAGPVAVDVAMGVATLAMNRIGVAKAKMASGQIEVASPVATLANPEPVASVASAGQTEMATLASDWANLEKELDEQMASMVADAQAALEPIMDGPLPTPPAGDPGPDPLPAEDRAPLTTVPAEAAKRIQEALEDNPKASAVAIAEALVAAGLAPTPRSGRRYVAAVKNGTARVS
jgi:hypothetical protein